MTHRAMASLYANEGWSKNATEETNTILNNISEAKGEAFPKGVNWLRKRHEEGDLSLSDLWGVMVCDIKGVPVSV